MIEMTTLHGDGVFLRREAIACGYDDRAIARALRSKDLVRVRHGAFTTYQRWQEANERERHWLRACAVLRSHGNRVALSHTSAAVDHGLSLLKPDLRRVHVTRLDSLPGGMSHDVCYHVGDWKPDDIVQLDDRLLLSPARVALETASLQSIEAGVVVLDSVLERGLAVEGELHAEYRRRERWPRSRRLQISLRLARTGSQSVGETCLRMLCFRHHIPEPILQYKVYDDRGVLIGIADFAWPEYGLLGEFDGRVKYLRYRRAGESAADVVIREKRREDKMRAATGFSMIRFMWTDLHTPEATAAQIRVALQRQVAG